MKDANQNKALKPVIERWVEKYVFEEGDSVAEARRKWDASRVALGEYDKKRSADVFERAARRVRLRRSASIAKKADKVESMAIGYLVDAMLADQRLITNAVENGTLGKLSRQDLAGVTIKKTGGGGITVTTDSTKAASRLLGHREHASDGDRAIIMLLSEAEDRVGLDMITNNKKPSEVLIERLGHFIRKKGKKDA